MILSLYNKSAYQPGASILRAPDRMAWHTGIHRMHTTFIYIWLTVKHSKRCSVQYQNPLLPRLRWQFKLSDEVDDELNHAIVYYFNTSDSDKHQNTQNTHALYRHLQFECDAWMAASCIIHEHAPNNSTAINHRLAISMSTSRSTNDMSSVVLQQDMVFITVIAFWGGTL